MTADIALFWVNLKKNRPSGGLSLRAQDASTNSQIGGQIMVKLENYQYLPKYFDTYEFLN